MDKRYSDKRIEEKWSKDYKTRKWDQVELAVIRARGLLLRIPGGRYDAIKDALRGKPVDMAWWEAREAETGHDYDSYCDERRRHLPPLFQHHWHEDLTTYDGQDPAFVLILRESVGIVKKDAKKLLGLLAIMAKNYRYCFMMGKTHRQYAEVQTFGKRCLTWLKELQICYQELLKAEKNLRFAKLAGPVGNYGLLDPELEKETCSILHVKVLYGVTQIIPRALLVPVASALSLMAQSVYKIANDICEGTSGSHPIWHVPFPKKGKGSSAMAWKRNPWRAEGLKGFADMALGRELAIKRTVKTAFERDIGQSCVERNEWPDLFHIVLYSMKTIAGVLEKLEVYPDNMMREIDDVHGCYAGLAARDFLVGHGFTSEEAYRVVQLAAWIALKPTAMGAEMRKGIPTAELAFKYLAARKERRGTGGASIQDIIKCGWLVVVPELDPTEEQVSTWNKKLAAVFQTAPALLQWDLIFSSVFERTLKNEQTLYNEILGE